MFFFFLFFILDYFNPVAASKISLHTLFCIMHSTDFSLSSNPKIFWVVLYTEIEHFVTGRIIHPFVLAIRALAFEYTHYNILGSVDKLMFSFIINYVFIGTYT